MGIGIQTEAATSGTVDIGPDPRITVPTGPAPGMRAASITRDIGRRIRASGGTITAGTATGCLATMTTMIAMIVATTIGAAAGETGNPG